jgi:hypothetical protein
VKKVASVFMSEEQAEQGATDQLEASNKQSNMLASLILDHEEGGITYSFLGPCHSSGG